MEQSAATRSKRDRAHICPHTAFESTALLKDVSLLHEARRLVRRTAPTLSNCGSEDNILCAILTTSSGLNTETVNALV